LNWFQNILAFSVLSIVTPLTYAVCSASKRIFVIAISLFILGNPVTWMNLLGMMIACGGVLMYNRAKYYARHQQNKLPTYVNEIKYRPLAENSSLLNGKAFNNNYDVRNSPTNLLLNGGTVGSSNSKLLFV
jgi:solute carrier family 35 protein E1